MLACPLAHLMCWNSLQLCAGSFVSSLVSLSVCFCCALASDWRMQRRPALDVADVRERAKATAIGRPELQQARESGKSMPRL